MERDYKCLVSGRFAEPEVKIELAGEFEQDSTHGLEKSWDMLLAQAKEQGFCLFNGHLLGLRQVRSEGGELLLSLHSTDFKTFSFTNYPGTRLVRRADALGNSVVLVTSDDKLIIGKRSDKVFRDKGKYHCIGGHLEAVAEGEEVDTFKSIKREILEELNIGEEAIVSLSCLGILQDSSTMQPEQIFCARLNQDSGMIQLRGDEHHSLELIHNSRKAINDFIAVNRERLVPVARGALEIYSQQEFRQK